MYLAYATSFFNKGYEQIGYEQRTKTGYHRFVSNQGNYLPDLSRWNLLSRIKKIENTRRAEWGKLFVGIALLLFTSDLIVKMSVGLAETIRLPLFIVGLFVVAIGTSLPELAFSFRALSDGEPTMFFGNLIGSTIANSTLVVGLSALIFPVNIGAFKDYANSAIFFVVVFLSFIYFIKSKRRLDRWEALFLIGIYTLFALFEFNSLSR